MLHEVLFWKGVIAGIIGTYVVAAIGCIIIGAFLYKGGSSDEQR